MRIGLLLLCVYGLSISSAQASTLSLSRFDLPAVAYNIPLSMVLANLTRGDLSPASITLNAGSSIDAGTRRNTLISLAPIEILSGGDITISSSSGADITLWSNAGTIKVGMGSPAGNITVLPVGNISLGSGSNGSGIRTQVGGSIILVSPRGVVDYGEVGIISEKNVSISPGVITLAQITNVPLPATFPMLLSGLLALVSVSRRSLLRKA